MHLKIKMNLSARKCMLLVKLEMMQRDRRDYYSMQKVNLAMSQYLGLVVHATTQAQNSSMLTFLTCLL